MTLSAPNGQDDCVRYDPAIHPTVHGSIKEETKIYFDPKLREPMLPVQESTRANVMQGDEPKMPVGYRLSDSGIGRVVSLAFSSYELKEHWSSTFSANGAIKMRANSYVGFGHFHHDGNKYNLFGYWRGNKLYWTYGHRTAVPTVSADGKPSGSYVRLSDQIVPLLPSVVLKVSKYRVVNLERHTGRQATWQELDGLTITEQEAKIRGPPGLQIRLAASEKIPPSPDLLAWQGSSDEPALDIVSQISNIAKAAHVDLGQMAVQTPEGAIGNTVQAAGKEANVATSAEKLVSQGPPLLAQGETNDKEAETSAKQKPKAEPVTKVEITKSASPQKIKKSGSQKRDYDEAFLAPDAADAEERLDILLENTDLASFCSRYLKSRSAMPGFDRSMVTKNTFVLFDDPGFWIFVRGYMESRVKVSERIEGCMAGAALNVSSDQVGAADEKVFALMEDKKLWRYFSGYRAKKQKAMQTDDKSLVKSQGRNKVPSTNEEIDENLYDLLERPELWEVILGYEQSR